ncbi:unnamed protein product [Caretta caretta]
MAEYTIWFLLNNMPLDLEQTTDASLQGAELCKVIRAVQVDCMDPILKRTLSALYICCELTVKTCYAKWSGG